MTSASNEDFFNDPNMAPPSSKPSSESTPASRTLTKTTHDDDEPVPRPKRIACVICRKRKLKCDGIKPSCGTCTRLSHDCAYDEVRRKSGPKRGYVKALEARLAQVETLLKTQESPETEEPDPMAMNIEMPQMSDFTAKSTFISTDEGINFAIGTRDSPLDAFNDPNMFTNTSTAPGVPDFLNYDIDLGTEQVSWEMIGLGLSEPLPAQDIIDDLEQIFFDKLFTSSPIIHRTRYMAACNLPPNLRPPVCLRYSMWALAASISTKYYQMAELFYQRARKYLESGEMNSAGLGMINVQHCQCWSLVASYEFKLMYFPRAWLSTGRAVRMAQMMGLYRLDGSGLDVKQCLPPPRDWIEKEERRRAFWMAFCADRYASVGTGWPMTLDEKDVVTNLPCSNDAWLKGIQEETPSLKAAMTPAGASQLSSFAALALMACLFGRNLIHLHRPDEDGRDGDLNGDFWKRHRHMDSILLNTSLSLPDHLRLPSGLNDANIIFVNMNIHTATICLHQAAIYKADKNRLPASISAESKIRCVTAASEIATIMRTISHLDLSVMNPFMAFCLYVSARVFVQYIKSRPNDGNAKDSLSFLLAAMQQLKTMNPLVTSFLVQLDVDLEGVGLKGVGAIATQHIKENWPHSGMHHLEKISSTDDVHCSPLVNIRDSSSLYSGADSKTDYPHSQYIPMSDCTADRPSEMTADPVPSSIFPCENQMNLPNRLKSNIRSSPKDSNTSAQPFQFQSATSSQPNGNGFTSQHGRGSASSQSSRGFRQSSQIIEMDMSPDTNGSSGSGGLNSGGHPTPETMTSNQSSVHNGQTPPSRDDLGPDPHRTGGASNAGGPRGMWNMAYIMDQTDPSDLTQSPAKEQDASIFGLPQDWDVNVPPTGMTPDASNGFNGLMEAMGWDSFVPNEVQQPADGRKSF